MKGFRIIFLITVFATINLFSQQLPLQIGNQWHYDSGIASLMKHKAIATDTVLINDITYYKIDHLDVNTDTILWSTYDRMDGDSLYYRIVNEKDTLIFNFNWYNGQIVSQPSSSDSSCIELKYIERDTAVIWGVLTDVYSIRFGNYCPEMEDTAWTLSTLSYLKYFGCNNAEDGKLIGAIINGMVYGDLHFIPVELLSFSKKVIVNSIQLKWLTATETNNYGFEIFRYFLTDNEEKQYLGFVKGNGTTSETKNYEFEDKNLSPGSYKYLLTQIDYDGTREEIAETEIYIGYPNSYKLHQNYPNPFNPTTKIEFVIVEESDVNFFVYNVLGELIYQEELMNVKPGRHHIIFNGGDLASGLYLYQIKTVDFMDTKEMFLLK